MAQKILHDASAQEKFNQTRLAKLISQALHPFLISILGIMLILYLDTGHLLSALGWAGLCALIVVAPAILLLRRRLKAKTFSDADVSVRSERHGFYIFGGICMLICFAVLLWLDAPRSLIVLFTAGGVSVATMAVITKLWSKASIHIGVVTGIATATAFYSIPLALLLALATLLVTWARLTLKRHTPIEAALGMGIAVVAVSATFLIML